LCRAEVEALFARQAAAEPEPEPEPEGAEALPAELWDKIKMGHRAPSTTCVIHLRRLPAPAFESNEGSLRPLLRAAGLRGGGANQSSAAVELGLGDETYALLTVDGSVLHARLSRQGRGVEGAILLISARSSSSPLRSAETDRFGRAQLVLSDLPQADDLDVAIRF
jgi:hypothetical protein